MRQETREIKKKNSKGKKANSKKYEYCENCKIMLFVNIIIFQTLSFV